MSGDEASLPDTGPESRSSMTSELSATLGSRRGHDEQATYALLNSSAADSHVRTSPSLADAQDSRDLEAVYSTSSPGSPTLFDPSGFSSRTYRVSSVQTAVGTSESCLERWPTSGTAWRGGFSTAVSSECRSADGECSSSEPSLADILEPNVPARFSLSAKAAIGILRRAEKRGRALSEPLKVALQIVAGASAPTKQGGASR